MVLQGRRGAENVIASLILFIAVMALATTTTIVFKNYLDKSANAVNTQQTKSVDVMQTSFTIDSAAYNGVNTTRIYVKNTGSTQFDPGNIDVYLNGVRIPRSNANRTINVTPDTDTINTGIWDPGEELEIDINHSFTSSSTQTILVAAPNGVTATGEFSS